MSSEEERRTLYGKIVQGYKEAHKGQVPNEHLLHELEARIFERPPREGNPKAMADNVQWVEENFGPQIEEGLRDIYVNQFTEMCRADSQKRGIDLKQYRLSIEKLFIPKTTSTTKSERAIIEQAIGKEEYARLKVLAEASRKGKLSETRRKLGSQVKEVKESMAKKAPKSSTKKATKRVNPYEIGRS